MAFSKRIFHVSLMCSILVFALIHVGVSIGIIIPDRHYGDIFQPQIGLAAFNLVIFLVALITGVLGVFSVLKSARPVGKITAIISITLAVFALASLVAAIVINAKSTSYVSTRFTNNMNNYQFNTNAANIVDRVQTQLQCCGNDLWVDWANVGLYAMGSATNGANSTSATTVAAGQSGSGNTTISQSGLTTTTAESASGAGSGTSTNPTVTGAQQTGTGNNGNGSTGTGGTRVRREWHPHSEIFRQKRQLTTTYGGIYGLPLTFNVTLPVTCCTSGAILAGNGSNYCISNANNLPNKFNTNGCSKLLDVTAGNQAMGIGVINCFMVVLASMAIPILIDIQRVQD